MIAKCLKRSVRISSVAELSRAIGQSKTSLDELVTFPERNYRAFTREKKSGGVRVIHAPSRYLKLAQHSLLGFLYQVVRVPSFMFGGVPGKSIFTHARRHVGRAMVATLDVRDFYPSMRRARIEELLWSIGFRGAALQYVLELTLLDDALPQGAPTSCFLANFGFLAVDRRFLRLARRRRLTYGRFVDDVALSGNDDFRDLKGTLISFIVEEGFVLAKEKVFFCSEGERQVVTGLVVNEKLRPTIDYIRKLNQTIAIALECGAGAAASLEGKSVIEFKRSLNGRVQHLKQADPELGEATRKKLFGIQWNRDIASTGADC